MTTPLLFVHGGGEGGPAAWPLQAAAELGREARFLYRPGFAPGEDPRATDFEADAVAVSEAAAGGAHVVAHSYGGLSAMRAVELDPSRVVSLILLEPIAFGPVRGDAAVEEYVASLAVMERAGSMTAADYLVELMAAMGAGEIERPTTEAELVEAERWRLLAPPWSAPVSADVAGMVPTLVISGGWNPAQEVLDRRLEQAGARLATVAGTGHMVQYSEETTALIIAFVDEVEASHATPPWG